MRPTALCVLTTVVIGAQAWGGRQSVRLSVPNGGDQGFHVGGPATVIDIPAIRLRVDSRYLSSSTLECPWAHIKRRAIRTIDDNP